MNALAPSLRFKSASCAGYLTGGHEHGVHLTEGADGQPVTRPMCLNLEHYYARGCRGGRFVPRYKAEVQSEIQGDQLVLRIAPFADWQVTAEITYRIPSDGVIEATFEFQFAAPYQDFEAFVSNYFHAPAEPYMHLGDGWTQPQLTDAEHRYWSRSARDSAALLDGRLADGLAELKEAFTTPVDARWYVHPILITPIGTSGWSVINIAEKEHCPSLSANRRWQAHDFSLVGRDVAGGERVTTRAWMIYAKLLTWDDAMNLIPLCST